jgi:inosose dehydratase
MSTNSLFNRRQVLAGAVAGVGAALLGRAEAKDSPYGPFKMGIQSYTLRGYDLDHAIAHSQELGLHYWESFPSHIPLTKDPAQVEMLLGKLKAADIKMTAHGVHGFGKDAAANRNIFECAKALGVTTLSADPAPEAFDNLEQLVEEFKINIAIHNHGPGARYDKISSVVNAVKGRHKRIGACVDCGHYLRSKESPVAAIEALGERVYGCHLKDVKDATQFTIIGKGDLDIPGVLRALNKLKYKEIVALEYEEHPEDPMADLRESYAAVRAAVEKI